MPTTGKNHFIRNLSASPTTLVPAVAAATYVVINMISFMNFHVSSILVGMDAIVGGSDIKILNDKNLDPNKYFTWDGVIILETGDTIRIRSSNTTGILDVFASVLENT